MSVSNLPKGRERTPEYMISSLSVLCLSVRITVSGSVTPTVGKEKEEMGE